MKVKRIIPNIAATNPASGKAFYSDLLGLAVAMDLDWIVTFEADVSMRPQISIAVNGGSNTAVPDITVEVDDLEEALRRFRRAGIALEYGPAREPWGVRRFFVRDPFGRLLNIMTHSK